MSWLSKSTLKRNYVVAGQKKSLEMYKLVWLSHKLSGACHQLCFDMTNHSHFQPRSFLLHFRDKRNLKVLMWHEGWCFHKSLASLSHRLVHSPFVGQGKWSWGPIVFSDEVLTGFKCAGGTPSTGGTSLSLISILGSRRNQTIGSRGWSGAELK